ncbi:hypothetical protein D3C87_1419260 [compost metagenome]
MATVVHPHAEPEHHDAGKQRRRTFEQLALRAADVDHVCRQCPGSEAGQQRQAPADIDAAHRRLLAGVTQEGEDRRQHQNRFQPFTQKDQQTGNVTQGPAQTIAAQQAGRDFQFGLGRLQTLLDLLQRQAILQRLTVSHQ